MPKIKFLKPGYYNCNYPEGAVVNVDSNYANYVIGLGTAKLANDDEKITDPVPYVMKPRKSGSDEALSVIAEALTGKKVEAKDEQHPQPVTKNVSTKG